MYKVFYLFTSLLFCLEASAQKIEYSFGQQSDVIDSVKSVIEKYKTLYGEKEVGKLGLYAGIDYSEGNMYLSVSRYFKEKDIEFDALVNKTNRVIRIDSIYSLPLIFSTDILSEEIMGKRALIPFGGYCIVISKNKQYIWRVAKVQITF